MAYFSFQTVQGEYITSFTRGSIGILSISRSINLSDFISELTNDNLKFLSVYEEDKGKPKKIVVTGNIPLVGSGKYLAYGFTNGSRTSEEVAELKIDKLLNKYDAIAEIKKEESVIQKLLDSKFMYFLSLALKS